MNPKGGSGKTTIATNLAAYYAAAGRRVTMLDQDAQSSTSRWLSKRPDAAPHIHGIDTFKDHVGVTRSFATRIPPDAEIVVVDTAAALATHELTDAVSQADKILLPVLPSDIDIHAAARCIADLLIRAKVQRSDNRLAIIANRVKRNTIVFHSLMRFLDALEIPVAAVLRDSQNYIRSAESGLGVHELKTRKIKREIEQWSPIIDWLEHGTIRPTSSWTRQPANVTVLDPLRKLNIVRRD